MHAITLKQPWAYAVCHLGKCVENRTRKPPAKLIGQRVAIHAGAAWDGAATGIMRAAGLWPDGVDSSTRAVNAAALEARGAIVATALLVGWVADNPKSLVLLDCNDGMNPGTALGVRRDDWFTGPVGHVLSDVRVLAEPVPCRGQLGYWRLPVDVEAAVLKQEGRPSPQIIDLFEALKDSLSAGSGGGNG